MTLESAVDNPALALKRVAKTAHWAVVALIFGFGGWGVTAEIAGAVIAKGQLVVESDVKKVQHQTGGVIGELKVREGQRVRTGDILLRLDATVIRSNLAIIENTLLEQRARQARLEAER